MSLPNIVIQGDPYPMDLTEDWHLKIPRHEAFCFACCNLSPATAYSLLPREGLLMNETNTGTGNVQMAKARGLYDESEPIPVWAGASRLDYTSFHFTAFFPDLVERASQGCASCSALITGIVELSDGKVSRDAVSVEVDIVFCRGDVLRALIYTGDLDQSSDIFGASHRLDSRQLVQAIEFYTLPGRCLVSLLRLF